MDAPEEAARGTDAIIIFEGFQAESAAIDYGLRESSYFAYPFVVEGGMSLALESALTVGIGQNEANLPY